MSQTHTKSQKKDEVETFFPSGGKVKLPSLDKPVEIKKFKWGKEAKLGKLLGSLLSDVNLSDFTQLTEQNIKGNPQIIFSTFLPLLDKAPDTLTKMVAIILEKDEDWVDNELGPEDIIEVLVPFFTGAFKKYQSLFGDLNQRFQKQ